MTLLYYARVWSKDRDNNRKTSMMSFRRPVNSTTLNLAEVSSLPRVHGHWRRVRGMESVITRQALLRPIRAQNLTILSIAIPEKLKGGVKF